MSGGVIVEESVLDKSFKLGPIEYSIKVWLLIILVVIGVYIYFTRYYYPDSIDNSNAYYY
jgi:hypothetical protein